MRQPLAVGHYWPFDAGHFFAGIVAFVLRTIGVFYALRVNDAETRHGLAPLLLGYFF